MGPVQAAGATWSKWRGGHLTPQDYQGLRNNPNVTVIAPYGTEVQYVVMTE
jgi:hypothetical protein